MPCVIIGGCGRNSLIQRNEPVIKITQSFEQIKVLRSAAWYQLRIGGPGGVGVGGVRWVGCLKKKRALSEQNPDYVVA